MLPAAGVGPAGPRPGAAAARARRVRARRLRPAADRHRGVVPPRVLGGGSTTSRCSATCARRRPDRDRGLRRGPRRGGHARRAGGQPAHASGIAYAIAARESVPAGLPDATARRRAGWTTPSRSCAPRCGRHAAGGARRRRPPRRPPHRRSAQQRPLGARVARPALGVPLVEAGDVCPRGDRLLLRATMRPIDVVYRRTDADRADSYLGRLLIPPLAAGTLGLVNAFGTGVADDKLVHSYVADMVRFYLGRSRPPVRADVRPRAARRPRRGAGPLRRARGQAARRPRRHRRGGSARTRGPRTSRRRAARSSPTRAPGSRSRWCRLSRTRR